MPWTNATAARIRDTTNVDARTQAQERRTRGGLHQESALALTAGIEQPPRRMARDSSPTSARRWSTPHLTVATWRSKLVQFRCDWSADRLIARVIHGMLSACVSAMATRKRSGSRRKYGRKAQSKVKRALHERKRGTLKSGRSGKKVKSKKQAIAIALSQARRSGAKVPKKRTRGRSRRKA